MTVAPPAASAPTVPGRVSPTAVFRRRDFALLWVAQLVSTAGSSLTDLAASIYVYQQTGSAFLVGLTLMATAVPSLLVGLIAGVFVDRWDRRRVMIVASLVQAIIVSLIPLLIGVHVALLYVAILANAGVKMFFEPAYESLIPEIASDDELAAANAFLAIASFGSTAIGFAGAGLLASAFSIDWAFWIDALTFLFSAACVASLRVRVPAPAVEEEASVAMVAANLRVGLRTIFDTPVLRSMFVLLAPVFFAFGLWNVLLLPMAIRVLGASEFQYGIQEGLTSLGFVAGSLVMARHSERLPTGTWIVVGCVGMGVAGVGYGLSPVIGVAIVWATISGALNSPLSVARQTLLQRHTPRELRGRVFSAMFVVRDVIFLVGMASAGLADIIDIRLLVIGASLILVAIGGVSLFAPGIGRPAAEWRRGLRVLRAGGTGALGPARPAAAEDLDVLVSSMTAFGRLDGEQRDALLRAAVVREVAAGVRVITRGDAATSAWFILAGEAVAGIPESDGGYRVLSVMGTGDVFGEIAALTGSARTADVVATEASTLLEVPAEALRGVMVVPEISRLMLATLSERLLRSDQPDLPRLSSLDQASLRELRQAVLPVAVSADERAA
jgi:CRP-like cAMP-binding protein/Na+/melibiose symporter-like transporter